MKNLLCPLFIAFQLLLAPALRAQSPAQSSSDSLRAALAIAAPEDSVGILIDLVKTNIMVAPDTSVKYAFALMNLQRQRRDTAGQIEAHIYLAPSLSMVHATDTSLAIGLSLLPLFTIPPFDTLGAPYGSIKLQLAGDYQELGQLEKSLNEYREAMPHVAPNSIGQSNLYNNLSNLYWSLENYDSSIVYSQLRIGLERKLGRKRSLYLSLENMGSTYTDVGRYEEALAAFREALALKKEVAGSLQSTTLSNICRTLVRMEQDSAWQVCREAISATRAEENWQHLSTTSIEMASLFEMKGNQPDSQRYYLQQALEYQPEWVLHNNYLSRGKLSLLLLDAGQKRKALEVIRQAKADYEENPLLNQDEQDFLFTSLAQVEFVAGDPDSAAVYLRRGLKLHEETFRKRREASVAEALARYGVQETNFKLEREKLERKQEQENARAQQKLYSLGAVGGGLILFLGGFAFWRIARDRGLIQLRNEQLATALVERENLLREIHHRVKNNLQVISGLLHKQARISGSEAVKASLKEGQERLQAMALVHQKLYQQDSLRQINVREFFVELSDLLYQSNPQQVKGVSLELDVDDVELDMDRAIPLGLILNELVTNAYKYAFGKGAAGRLRIVFTKSTDTRYYLRVEDNGPGLPQEIVQGKSGGLGLQLVRGLARQLEGTCNINSKKGGGTLVELRF